MQNYSEYTAHSQASEDISGATGLVKHTWLHISFKDDITADLGNDIPYPQHYYKHGDSFVYCWLVDGFFHTNNNVRFLNDIIARFKLTYPNSKHLKTTITNETNINPLKLKAFQGLKSKANEVIKEYKQLDSLIHRDSTFWVLKLYAEKLIRQDGMIIYQRLEQFALENFGNHKKGWSTVRMKIASIYNWYFDRDWQIGRVTKTTKTKEEIMASRQEHAKKIHTKLANDTKKKVLNCITGMFAHEYKKANGKWNIMKIAKDSGTTRPTVMKYLPKETLF